MAIKEIVTKTKLDALANSIALKSGVSAPFTIDEMKTVVDNMSIGGDFITQSKIISPQLTDQTITPDQGYDGLSDVTVKAMPSGSAGVPVASKGSVSNHTVNITPTVTNTAGYISGGTETGTPVTVSASELVSGTKNINSNNTYDVSNYASVNVNVPTSVNLQQKTATPTESVQTIVADDNYDGLSSVEVEAISNTYVGSGIERGGSLDISSSLKYVDEENGKIENTVVATAGYYQFDTNRKTTSSIVAMIADLPTQSATTITPTESQQTAVSAKHWITGDITVDAIPSTYVGSEVTRRTSTDLTRSTYTINVPAGYYEESASKAVERVTHATPQVSINSSTGVITATHTQTQGWVEGSGTGTDSTSKTLQLTTQTAKTVTPTEESQQAVASGVYTTGAVTVAAIPSDYVGSGITERDSDDLTVSSATVSVPAGYYSSTASKSVASGTTGTPTATKGTVSNHSISVTPSVTNTTGYITGGTKSGTAVSVSASELVSGTYSITSSGTKDVTNYASVSVSAGTEGTPTATKGSVSNHSISVTPSVTNSSGFITGSTKTGTAVSVSASELVSGTKSITANGTGIDVTNYASVNVAVENTDFIVTLTKNSSTGNWEPDCTYAELLAAYNAGKEIVFKATNEDQEYPALGNYVENAQNNPFYYEVDETYNDLVHTNVVYTKGYFLTSSGSSVAANYTYHFTEGANASASDVISGKIFYNASGYQTGTLVVQHYYTGSSAPSSSLGANGDIYLQS